MNATTNTPYTKRLWAPWKRLGQYFLSLISSMEMGVLLLIFIAISCIAGSLLPQIQLVDTGAIQRQFGDAYPYLNAMGLFDLFYSPWFIALEVLFFFSICIGSFRWLRPAWLSITQKTLMDARHIRATSRHHVIDVASSVPPPEILATMKMALEQQGFDVTGSNKKHPWSLYATKGRLGRVGPMITHVGIALVMLAVFWGAFTSFTAQHLAKPGETFAVSESETFATSTKPPFWFGSIPDYRVQIDRFDIDFQLKAPMVPKQFTTHLSLIDTVTGETLKKGVTSVNNPFRYKGLTFYQANFSPTTLHTLTINGVPQRVDANQTLAGRPFAIHPLNETTRLFIFPLGRFTDGLQVNRVEILQEKNGKLLGFDKGFSVKNKNVLGLTEGADAQAFAGQKIGYTQAVMSTGLQMKYAPETWFLYVSLIVLALGCVMSAIPHYQVWLALGNELNTFNSPPNSVAVYSKAKKHPKRLARQLERVLDKLPTPAYKHHGSTEIGPTT